MKTPKIAVRRMRALAVVCLVAAGRAPAASGQTQEAHAPRALFQFRSGFWINLHHFLYQQAQAEVALKNDPESREGRLAARVRFDPETLPPDEREPYLAARRFYAESVAGRDLLFDAGMVQAKELLRALADDERPAGEQLPAGLGPALETAAEVYRERLWPEHDAANRRFIAALEPLLEEHGEPLRAALVKVYRTPWPAEPVAVDVTIHAGWAGAYTTLAPTHVTIASRDSRNQGNGALEILFHEASHGLVRHWSERIDQEAARRGRPPPRNFWHALLFFTTGELVRRRIDGYVPYAEQYGLYERGWQEYRRVLSTHWQASMDDPDAAERALADMMEELLAPEEERPSGAPAEQGGGG